VKSNNGTPLQVHGEVMEACAYYAGFIPGENGKVSVIFPDVPGCATWGENMEHAFAMAVDALAGHLECMAETGKPSPHRQGMMPHGRPCARRWQATAWGRCPLGL